ncbi:helix-turn-helix domain-containing protein [Bradyrhizobium diazoefficiens]|uniref:helix-turn-helix domain-containing protein n=4 Tax=Nitrobacteraceae TaxID=41294 RepID=UPI0018E35FBF
MLERPASDPPLHRLDPLPPQVGTHTLDAPQLRRGAKATRTKLVGKDQEGLGRQPIARDPVGDLLRRAAANPGRRTAAAERLEDAVDGGQELEPRINHAPTVLHTACSSQISHIDVGIHRAFKPIMPPYMADEINEIGDRLRWIREARQMNQATFCRLVKIEQQAWNNYERGTRRISLDQALKVCAKTGASLDFIYRGISSALPHDLAMAIEEQQRKGARRR